jgi:hypothetical protein
MKTRIAEKKGMAQNRVTPVSSFPHAFGGNPARRPFLHSRQKHAGMTAGEAHVTRSTMIPSHAEKS